MQIKRTPQCQWVIDTLKGKRNGFFLDIGATSGVDDGNNTLHLETEYGWRGICVEPNPQYFQFLKENRKCICVNHPIWDKHAYVEFVYQPGILGAIKNNITPQHGSYLQRLGKWDGKTTMHMLAITPRQLLKDYNAPRHIDYMSLDAELTEFEILKAFPFNKYKVDLMTIENHEKDVYFLDKRKFLINWGYDLVKREELDDYFIRRGAL